MRVDSPYNQLDSELVANLNYVLRYELAVASDERYGSGRFAGEPLD